MPFRSPHTASPPGEIRVLADKVVAALALAVAAVPMAITALIVFATLGRPLLFAQRRVGLGGHVFTISKFRTMHDSRDAAGVPLPDALRETATTRLLRRLRLDELPQLVAIMRGDMALIGPRPLLPATVEAMGALGRLRCSIRPGLSGWAQVSGNTRLDDRQKLALDIWYIDHRSLALDLRIVLDTILVLLRGEHLDAARIAAAEAHLAERAAPVFHAEGQPACA
jgi:lipopolysaccharide/colanic/teichoic acid biosynthesis glycosyltransferase